MIIILYFDITNQENALDFVTKVTNLSRDEIFAFITEYTIQDGVCTDTTKVNVDNMIEQFDIGLNSSIIDEIRFCAIHYTSNNDNNKSIITNGLRDLQYALQNNTPLQEFLQNFDIHFNVDNHIMTVKGKQFDISYERYDVSEPVTHIARKVYYDNQLSCFFRIEDISDYLGYVHYRPEILFNIDELCHNLDLSHKWYKQSKSYEIKFWGQLYDFTSYTFETNGKPLLHYLIDLALDVIADNCSREIYAYLKPDTIIPYQNIIYIQEL